MKYRVKFQCYWYNTGTADNHSYDRNEDFDTLEDANSFARRVDIQFDNSKRRVLLEGIKNEPASDYELKYCPPITSKEIEEWDSSENFVEVENGFIEGYARILEYHPSKEIEIS